jgi:hypothetical protein
LVRQFHEHARLRVGIDDGPVDALIAGPTRTPRVRRRRSVYAAAT